MSKKGQRERERISKIPEVTYYTTDGMRAGKKETQGLHEPANILVSIEGKYRMGYI